MHPDLLLAVGAGSVGLALLMLALAVGFRAGQLTGTARSLMLIELQVERTEVAREELPLTERVLAPLLRGTQGLARRLAPSGTGERLQRLLDRAGNPAGWTGERLMGAKGAALLGGALLGLFLGRFGALGLVAAGAGAAIGFFIPDLLVYNLGLKRQDELRRGLADALDMLTVCVEAGQGFDGALMQVARSVTGPIAGEFSRVLSEIQIGKSRAEAFSGFAARTSVPEVKTFLSSLIQADRLGLPLGAVLREQSVQMRLVRRQRAEEAAQKVPVKIIFPMLLCIFPSVFIVIMGPGVLRIMHSF